MARQGLFAEYVLNDSPTRDDVVAALDALGRLLRQVMRQRGVWALPPSAWDYAGRSWLEEETFNDLLFDCFAYVFDGEKGKRLGRLRHYARQQPSIDGAVRTAVWNFLNEQEKRKDPAGHAVFKNIQAAVAEALEVSRVQVASGTPDGITNETVVLSASAKGTGAGSLDILNAEVNGWADAPVLCGRMAKRSQRGIRAAATAVARLAIACPAGWRVGDLVHAVKQVLPRRAPGGFDKLASSAPAGDPEPSRPLEDADTVEIKSERTRKAIEDLPCLRKVKDRLHRLWECLLGHYRERGSFPKQTEVVEIVNLPRQRVSEDYGRLRPLLAEIWQIDPDK